VSDIFGSSNTTVQTTAPTSDAENQLIQLQTQLAQQQLGAIKSQQPLNDQLIASAQSGITRNDAYQKALDAAISPEDQAAAQAAQFKQAQELGPIQTQLAQMQLDALKQGGRATDQQKADIQSATDAAITAGTGDIDTQTKRGISMISDELANSRGLRLSDAPIGSEAALLERAAGDQKSSLINNLRANQASATLNYPLAVTGMTSGINLSQQNSNQAFTNFQDQLRQQAQTNRLALTGPAISNGLGLSSIGGGNGALSALDSSRGRTSDSSGYNGGQVIQGLGALGSGIGALAALSDRRLKTDIKKVGVLDSGIGLYTYRFKGADKTRHVGVMAQEVEKVLPEAVVDAGLGFKAVRYDKVVEHAAAA
jgi:hypothetical protein